MSEILYSVAGPSYDGKYGIMAVDQEERHYAAAMPFLSEREDAERLVGYLCAHQISIPSFCEAFIDGSLLEMI